MTPHTGLHVLLALICPLLATILCLRDPSPSNDPLRLTVTDARGTLLLTTPLPDGVCFGIRFIHSVARSPVEEWYCRHNASLCLEKTVYHDFGAGLPHRAEQGQNMRFTRGAIILEGFHRSMPTVTYRVGRIAKHELLLPHTDPSLHYPLRLLRPPGQSITFSLSAVHAP